MARALLTVALAFCVGFGLLATAAAQGAAAGAAAFAHVQHLAGTIGPRVAGTAGERQAAEYLATQLRQYGYAVELHAFQFPFFEARAVQAQVLGAAPRAVTAQALLLTTATPAAGIEAELVAAGLGRPEDFEGRRVSGAIVLIERGVITFREKVTAAAARGAAAVVVFNNQPGLVAGTLQQRSEIPAVIISQDDGRQLLEAVQRGAVRLRVMVDAVHETRTTSNVVATKRGTARPDEIVVVGAHYDSVPRSPGANDNASGTATVLEAARALAAITTPRTVQFVLFAAEELGLYGSAAFAAERRQGVVAMVNLDMVGWGERLMVGNGGRDDAIVELALRVAEEAGIQVRRFRAGASDHTSFERLGVPALFVHRGVDPDYHRPTDVPANVEPRHLDEAVRLTVALVRELTRIRSAQPAGGRQAD
jgi:aminopeptidase YwaD